MRFPTPTPRHERLKEILSGTAGIIDLASIMVGVIVLGLVASTTSATTFGAIPWSQDAAAKQSLSAIRDAEGVTFAQSTSVGVAKYKDSVGLVAAALLPVNQSVTAATDPAGTCYVGLSKSGTGKVYFVTDKLIEPQLLTAEAVTGCIDPAIISDPYPDPLGGPNKPPVIDAVGGPDDGVNGPGANPSYNPGYNPGGIPGSGTGGGGTTAPVSAYAAQCANPDAPWAVKDPVLKEVLASFTTVAPADLTVADAALVGFLPLFDSRIGSLEGVQCATNAQGFILQGTQVTDLSPIAGLPNISTVTISSNPLLTDLTGLSNIPTADMTISGNASLTSTAGLKNLPMLQSIMINDNPALQTASIAVLPKLNDAHVRNNASLQSVEFADLPLLQQADATDNTALETFSAKNLAMATDLSVTGAPKLTSYSATNLASMVELSVKDLPMLVRPVVSDMPSLKNLMLLRLTALKELGGIRGLDKLDSFYIQDDTSLRNISGLVNVTEPKAEFQSLTQLYLDGDTALTNVDAVYFLTPSLSILSVRGTAVSPANVYDLKLAWPSLTIATD